MDYFEGCAQTEDPGALPQLECVEEVSLTGPREARGKAPLHAAAKHPVGIHLEGLARERLGRSVRELDGSGRRIVGHHPEGDLLDLDLAPEVAKRNGPHALVVEEAHPAQERAVELWVRDADPLVLERPVAPKDQARRTEGGWALRRHAP